MLLNGVGHLLFVAEGQPGRFYEVFPRDGEPALSGSYKVVGRFTAWFDDSQQYEKVAILLDDGRAIEGLFSKGVDAGWAIAGIADGSTYKLA